MPQGVDRNTVERVKAEVMRRERSRAYSSNFGVSSSDLLAALDDMKSQLSPTTSC